MLSIGDYTPVFFTGFGVPADSKKWAQYKEGLTIIVIKSESDLSLSLGQQGGYNLPESSVCVLQETNLLAVPNDGREGGFSLHRCTVECGLFLHCYGGQVHREFVQENCILCDT